MSVHDGSIATLGYDDLWDNRVPDLGGGSLVGDLLDRSFLAAHPKDVVMQPPRLVQRSFGEQRCAGYFEPEVLARHPEHLTFIQPQTLPAELLTFEESASTGR